jgi:outer membrane protein OmpA-like peptidoglycan-associated protein
MNTKLWTAISVALLASACASIPQPNAALEIARSTVNAAEADPNVAKYAAVDLDAAKKQLQIADAAALRHDDAAIAQPAYLAAQTARLAELRATAKADDARVAAGQAQRDQIQLAARTREVDTAVTARDTAVTARDAASAESVRLQAQLDALKAKPTPRGLVLTLSDVLFETGKANLNSGGERKLDQLVQFLTEYPDRRVQIDGFTDSVGTDSYNLDLSQRRAQALQSALQRRGIDPARITSQGYGKEFPVATNADSGGRQLNRRVEIVIGAEDGAVIAARGR